MCAAPASPPASLLSRQATLLVALRDPRSYPHPVHSIEVIETHISWIVLTGRYVYKIKKALDLGFLDFTTLAQREFYCREELRLNIRLAPEIYLDVVAIAGTAAAPVVGGSGEIIEWALQMRQFERGAEMSHLLASGTITAEVVDEIADKVASFHEGCERSAPSSAFGSTEAIHGPVRENFDALTRLITDAEDQQRLERLAAWSAAEHERLTPVFEQRRAQGFVREGHGDLHLGNVALHAGHVLLFDCLEFDPALRWIDVMNDLAFLLMDLDRHERPDLARRCLNRWLERSGDYDGVAVLRYYLVYRALVRCKVSAIRAAQGGTDAMIAKSDAATLLSFAEKLSKTSAPKLLITHGVSGSGKTTVTRALIEVTDLIRVRSDVERKRLFGLPSDARSGSSVDQALYAKEVGQRTYAHLRALAQKILRTGYSVVVDAAFLDRAYRDAFRALANEVGVPLHILACSASRNTLRERIIARERHQRDASEAGVDVLQRQLETFTDLASEELKDVTPIDTSTPIDAQALARKLNLRE